MGAGSGVGAGTGSGAGSGCTSSGDTGSGLATVTVGIGVGAAFSGSTRCRRTGTGGGGGATGSIFSSTGFSGGSSMALGWITGGSVSGATLSLIGLSFGFGAGTGTGGGGSVIGAGGFSGRSVIGDRYCTTERTECTIGADCSASQSNARCRTPVVSSAGLDIRANWLMKRAVLQSGASPHCHR